jgi:hypothetical protein
LREKSKTFRLLNYLRSRKVFLLNPLVVDDALERGIDDICLKRVLFEWLGDRKKEQARAEIASLKKVMDCTVN